ncbi:hypothetical protein GGR50DRAFT_98700 [Xylaria sp. CBS 124048]|nr:hypothetical protein GGR50DRAFT_98700 [Xylaria sp. CBS 124048]
MDPPEAVNSPPADLHTMADPEPSAAEEVHPPQDEGDGGSQQEQLAEPVSTPDDPFMSSSMPFSPSHVNHAYEGFDIPYPPVANPDPVFYQSVRPGLHDLNVPASAQVDMAPDGGTVMMADIELQYLQPVDSGVSGPYVLPPPDICPYPGTQTMAASDPQNYQLANLGFQGPSMAMDFDTPWLAETPQMASFLQPQYPAFDQSIGSGFQDLINDLGTTWFAETSQTANAQSQYPLFDGPVEPGAFGTNVWAQPDMSPYPGMPVMAGSAPQFYPDMGATFETPWFEDVPQVMYSEPQFYQSADSYLPAPEVFPDATVPPTSSLTAADHNTNEEPEYCPPAGTYLSPLEMFKDASVPPTPELPTAEGEESPPMTDPNDGSEADAAGDTDSDAEMADVETIRAETPDMDSDMDIDDGKQGPITRSRRRNRRKAAAANREAASTRTRRPRPPVLTVPLSVLAKQHPYLPVKDMDDFARRGLSGRVGRGRLRRPSNAFILYRAAYYHFTRALFPQVTLGESSRIMGDSWAMESEQVQRRFFDLSLVDYCKHHALIKGMDGATRKRLLRDPVRRPRPPSSPSALLSVPAPVPSPSPSPSPSPPPRDDDVDE